MTGEISAPPTSRTLDDFIEEVIEDELTVAVSSQVQYLEDTYLPMVRRAQEMRHEIPSDPVALGLSQFNERLARLRADMNELSTSLSLLIFEKRRAQDRRNKARTALDEKINFLITTDQEVIDAPGGQKGRELVARVKLQNEQRVVSYSERIYTIVLSYYEAIKLVLDSLKETKSDAMSQLAVIKQQISLGEVDGSKFPVDRGGVSPPRTKLQEAEAEVARTLNAPEGIVPI